MLASLRNTTAILFRHSWTTVLLALILPALYLLTFSGWVILLNFGYFFPAAIIHYKGKRMTGHIASILSMMLMVLFTLPLLTDAGNIFSGTTANYEDEDRIESIIGIDIPEFTVESSELTHSQSFDAESTTHATLKFKTLANKQFFDYLDSICKLEAPDTLAPNSKIFVAGLESYYNPWSKEKNEYQFSMIGDPLNKTLHKEDAFFMLTIKKYSPYAELSYGNF